MYAAAQQHAGCTHQFMLLAVRWHRMLPLRSSMIAASPHLGVVADAVHVGNVTYSAVLYLQT
jgi:hypothetical protein